MMNVPPFGLVGVILGGRFLFFSHSVVCKVRRILNYMVQVNNLKLPAKNNSLKKKMIKVNPVKIKISYKYQKKRTSMTSFFLYSQEINIRIFFLLVLQLFPSLRLFLPAVLPSFQPPQPPFLSLLLPPSLRLLLQPERLFLFFSLLF